MGLLLCMVSAAQGNLCLVAPETPVTGGSRNEASQSLNIVFVGDSITFGYLLKNPENEAPPAHAVKILQAMPGISSVCFANCGKNGFRTDQFLPDTPGSAWPHVRLAADSFTNRQGRLLFSIMLGANDAGVATPALYGSNLTALASALLANYPDSCMVIHHPLWSSKVPSSHPEVLCQYIPVINALVETFGQSHPGRIHLGDVKGWDFFEANHEKICFKETRDGLPYYIHPNAEGAAHLGQYWAQAIYHTVMGNVFSFRALRPAAFPVASNMPIVCFSY